MQSVQVETRRGEGLLFAKCPLGGILQVPVVIIRCLIVQWCALLHDVLITNQRTTLKPVVLSHSPVGPAHLQKMGRKVNLRLNIQKKKLPLFLLQNMNVAWIKRGKNWGSETVDRKGEANHQKLQKIISFSFQPIANSSLWLFWPKMAPLTLK